MVEFRSGIRGMALNLETDNVGVVIFGNDRYKIRHIEKFKKETQLQELVPSSMYQLERRCWVECSMPSETPLMDLVPSRPLKEKESKSRLQELSLESL
jgi:hypothetical protein